MGVDVPAAGGDAKRPWRERAKIELKFDFHDKPLKSRVMEQLNGANFKTKERFQKCLADSPQRKDQF
jgi:hypothetical protein